MLRISAIWQTIRYNRGMDQDQLEKSLADLPLSQIRYYPSTGSTNEQAALWAAQGAADLSLVAAGEQTAGRGRMGRKWVSLPGLSLAFSLVLHPERQAAPVLAHLSALGALAVCDAFQKLYSLEAQIKWPNDVLLDRKKVCGVLPELVWEGERLQAVVLGIGVNLGSALFQDQALQENAVLFPPTALQESLGYVPQPAELLKAVLLGVLHWRSRLGSAEFRQAWEARLAGLGQWAQVFQGQDPVQQGGGLEGKVLGLEADGSLRLLTRDEEIVSVQFGDVRLRPLSGSLGMDEPQA
jgi:BirA family transcriptional regulator, biotin operon repressor / biotin---[acetyl-CoA-carboxylase] ligase